MLCLVLALCLLAGCSADADELLSLPQLPAQHVLVQNQINQLLSDGLSLSAPLTGNDRASVQMVDLDQDGTDEALVFGVLKKNETVLPQVYIYRYVRSRYELAQRIDGVGDSIDTVLYPRMGPERRRILVIGWRLGTNPVCGLSVYSYDGRDASMLYNGEYTGLCAADFNGDTAEELLVLRHSAKEAGTATLFSYHAGSFDAAAAAPLTAGVTKPDSIRYEPVGAGYSGAVVDAMLAADADGESEGMITDVLIYARGRLSNVTYSETDQRSVSTFRPLSYPSRDIDGDGILEIPRISRLPSPQGDTDCIQVDWCVIGESQTLERLFTAYTAAGSSWYFIMPDTLVPSITLIPGDQETGRTSYLFCGYNSETGEFGRTFWEIYTITGMERNSAVSELGLFELARTSSSIYAVRLSGDSKIMTYTELSECFCLY